MLFASSDGGSISMTSSVSECEFFYNSVSSRQTRTVDVNSIGGEWLNDGVFVLSECLIHSAPYTHTYTHTLSHQVVQFTRMVMCLRHLKAVPQSQCWVTCRIRRLLATLSWFQTLSASRTRTEVAPWQLLQPRHNQLCLWSTLLPTVSFVTACFSRRIRRQRRSTTMGRQPVNWVYFFFSLLSSHRLPPPTAEDSYSCLRPIRSLQTPHPRSRWPTASSTPRLSTDRWSS